MGTVCGLGRPQQVAHVRWQVPELIWSHGLPGFGSGASSGIEVQREDWSPQRAGVGEDDGDRVCRSLGRMEHLCPSLLAYSVKGLPCLLGKKMIPRNIILKNF